MSGKHIRASRLCAACATPFTCEAAKPTKHCSRLCARRARQPSLHDRFWSFVDRSAGTDHCWPWTGDRNADGYGRFYLSKGHRTAASKMAYVLTFGPLPPDKSFTCHTCDWPPCCNPSHLFAGNALDNARDAVTKGRCATGARNGKATKPDASPPAPRGEYNATAKLTNAQAAALRAEYIPRKNLPELARKYGISYMTAYHVVRLDTYQDATIQPNAPTLPASAIASA